MVVFALAWLIAAESESGEITLARDPIGVQPLYYTVLPTGGLLYSDRIADMLADSRVSDELDQHAIALRILSQADLSRTEYLAIRPVPPGHVVTWTPDSVPVVQRYRDPTLLPPPDESMSFDDCVPATREALWSSTARALGDSTSVAAHISGGLDSTSIAVVANRILRKDGHRLLAGYSWSLSLNTGIGRGR